MEEVSELVRSLLAGVPTEEVQNPNTGTFPDAVLDNAEVRQNKSGSFSVNLTFSDGDRKRFAKFQLAEPDSHPLVGKKALDWQRALGIVNATDKRGYIVRGDDAAARLDMANAIVEAIKTAAVGKTIPYKTSERGDFEQSDPIRVIA